MSQSSTGQSYGEERLEGDAYLIASWLWFLAND
jgi:hypothetical protein